jgi:glycosyltransferase involved in cell wall biosynthesis
MQVLMFVSNAFVSDPRVYAEAKSLIEAGYEVTVVAWDRDKQNSSRGNCDGIDVLRLKTRLLPKRHNVGSPFWVGPNLLLWQRQAYRRALEMNREKHLDIIHCHDLDTLAIGTRLKRRLHLPLIYDAHEIYAYMVTKAVPRWMARMLLWLEKRWAMKADRIINVGEAQKRYFESITEKPVTMIMNCKPLQSTEYRPPDNENFTILYIGGLGEGRAILMLIQAVKELPGARCLIGGIGAPSYVATVKEECSKTSNATFLGRIPFDEVIPMTMKADVVFCMFDPGNPNNVMGTPNKLFEALVCGRPIVCTKGTYSGELVEQEEVGLAVEYNEQGLREAITKLRDTPILREKLGRNALKAAISKYNWQKQEEKLLELYRSIQDHTHVTQEKTSSAG